MMFYRKRYFMMAATGCVVAFFLLFRFGIQSQVSGEVSFSREPGFYGEEFVLELQSEWPVIYYTLDGSMPDRSSIKYTGPILIKDASSNANVYSARTDVSTGFEKEEIAQKDIDDPEYRVPDYQVDKATIVRAVAYDGSGNRGMVKSVTYFVGLSDKTGYNGMKTISIITEPDNLFDYKTGIYVTGEAYDNYEKQYRGTGIWYWREEFWAMWKANYRNRGKNWERKATCQFFDKEGGLLLTQDCGIRIHGGISRGYNPKSLNLYARREYDGNKRFQKDLFGTGYMADAVTLFQGGNDVRTKAKDYIVSEAARDLKIACMHYEPYVLFLDGEYWGVYWLNEKYDAVYLSYYYNVKKDNVILIKSGELEAGDEVDYKYYVDMVDFCAKSNVTVQGNYERVCELIDIESYIDYYAMMCYIGRFGDWPEANFALWRVKKEERVLYGDQKWRWMIYDLNSLGFEADMDTIQFAMDNDAMFQNLMMNDIFREKFLKRMEELSDTVFDAKNMENKISEYQTFMAEPMRGNDRRFYGDDSLSDFYRETEDLKNFFYKRREYLPAMINAHVFEAY